MRTPPAFWADPDGARHPAARLLSPLGSLYGHIVARKLARTAPQHAPIPVICAGNITMGGVGKTPFVSLLAARLKKMGHTPFILLRGYGGSQKGPLRVRNPHTAQEVGDEARMLARDHAVIISADRPAGAELAAREGADVLVMDDGFQNPTLAKDLSFLLIDGVTGLGNGLVFPAGPLRERPEAAIARAQAIIQVGGDALPSHLLPGNLPPVLTARLESVVPDFLRGKKVHAFSGIGRPEKFFSGLEAAGLTLLRRMPFPDHHPFTEAEILSLKAAAAADDAPLVTTEKDMARLSDEDAQGLHAIPARMKVDPEALLDQFLSSIPEPRR